MTQIHDHAKVERVVQMDTPADLAQNSRLSHDQAEKVETVALKRASQRQNGRIEIVVVTEEWSETYPSLSDPISESPVALVGEVIDYSQKAYKCRGTFWIDMPQLDNMTIREVEEADPDGLVSFVNEYDEAGLKYMPKSAIECVAVIGT